MSKPTAASFEICNRWIDAPYFLLPSTSEKIFMTKLSLYLFAVHVDRWIRVDGEAAVSSDRSKCQRDDRESSRTLRDSSDPIDGDSNVRQSHARSIRRTNSNYETSKESRNLNACWLLANGWSRLRRDASRDPFARESWRSGRKRGQQKLPIHSHRSRSKHRCIVHSYCDAQHGHGENTMQSAGEDAWNGERHASTDRISVCIQSFSKGSSTRSELQSSDSMARRWKDRRSPEDRCAISSCWWETVWHRRRSQTVRCADLCGFSTSCLGDNPAQRDHTSTWVTRTKALWSNVPVGDDACTNIDRRESDEAQLKTSMTSLADDLLTKWRSAYTSVISYIDEKTSWS